MTAIGVRRAHVPVPLVVGAAIAAWLVAWFVQTPLADWLTYELLGLERGSQVGGAVAFFAEDVPKVLLLLTGVVTLVTFLRSFISPERVRRALAGRGGRHHRAQHRHGGERATSMSGWAWACLAW